MIWLRDPDLRGVARVLAIWAIAACVGWLIVLALWLMAGTTVTLATFGTIAVVIVGEELLQRHRRRAAARGDAGLGVLRLHSGFLAPAALDSISRVHDARPFLRFEVWLLIVTLALAVLWLADELKGRLRDSERREGSA